METNYSSINRATVAHLSIFHICKSASCFVHNPILRGRTGSRVANEKIIPWPDQNYVNMWLQCIVNCKCLHSIPDWQRFRGIPTGTQNPQRGFLLKIKPNWSIFNCKNDSEIGKYFTNRTLLYPKLFVWAWWIIDWAKRVLYSFLSFPKPHKNQAAQKAGVTRSLRVSP